jgi:uncharacterized protein (DUF2141 family)
MAKQRSRTRQAGRAVALSLLAILGLSASSAHGCSLTIHVDGFRNTKGLIGAALFQNETGWPESETQAFARKAIPVPVPMHADAVLTFSDVPAGRYGIAVLHDENANHRLDRNIFRVPKEGFGFANNPHVGLSAPSWEDSSVQVTCPSTEVQIHLIYK